MPPRALKVVLGVSGSIAAYKSAELVRGLVKAGHEVRCVLTPGGAQFITPMTLAALSRHPVATALHDPALWDMAHLSWSGWADIVLVAPATADFIARLAHGRAEGVLDTLILATTCPVAVCPAMDLEMWAHKATQRNVAALREYGYQVWGPAEGELASGRSGAGRMLEPADIVSRVAVATRAKK